MNVYYCQRTDVHDELGFVILLQSQHHQYLLPLAPLYRRFRRDPDFRHCHTHSLQEIFKLQSESQSIYTLHLLLLLSHSRQQLKKE